MLNRKKCKHGHKWNEENVYTGIDSKTGRRIYKCRRCKKISEEAVKERRAIERALDYMANGKIPDGPVPM